MMMVLPPSVKDPAPGAGALGPSYSAHGAMAPGRSAPAIPLLAPAWRGRARVRAMPLPPSLAPEQRQAALEKAAAARRQRAELKEKLKMGSLSLKELLDQSERDEVVGKMKVL